MNATTTDLVSQTGRDEECELTDLGTASEETKGAWLGVWDGGAGWCWC